MSKQWEHDELQHDLACNLRANPVRMVWEDMQLGPSGSDRPDIFMLEKSYAQFKPVIYEIKVSVSDFRSDITSGKWHKYLKYASAVIFAVPDGLVAKNDIPDGCGLIVRKENVWRNTKKPTLQVIDTLPHKAWMKLLIDGVDRCHSERRERSIKYRIDSELVCKKFGKEMAEMLSDAQHAEYILKSRKSQIEELEKSFEERLEKSKKRFDDSIRCHEGSASQILSELRQALGARDEADAFEILGMARNAALAIDRDVEVNRLKSKLRSIEAALKDIDRKAPFLEVVK